MPLDEKSKELTAFSIPSGHFASKEMPFGISGAPLALQRFINSEFAELFGKSVFAFLDDTLIVRKDKKSTITKLQGSIFSFAITRFNTRVE